MRLNFCEISSYDDEWDEVIKIFSQHKLRLRSAYNAALVTESPVVGALAFTIEGNISEFSVAISVDNQKKGLAASLICNFLIYAKNREISLVEAEVVNTVAMPSLLTSFGFKRYSGRRWKKDISCEF